MHRIASRLTLVAAFFTIFAAPSFAQSERDEALRLESHWGSMSIVRGADGPVVGTAGLFRSVDVEKIVAGSPRAEAEAAHFRASHRKGVIASALGVLTFGVGLVATTNMSNNAATPILMVGGIGAVIWGARRFDSAYSSLSRAVWWYNRDLKSRD